MKKGFTLIEIIIVLLIISLLFGASIAYYNRYSDKKKLDTQVQKMDDILHLIQKKATAGEIYKPACESFSGYQVRFIGSQYSTYFCCNPACDDENSEKMETYTVDSPISFTASAPTVNFRPLKGNISDASDMINIEIENAATGDCSKITIEATGLMSLSDCD